VEYPDGVVLTIDLLETQSVGRVYAMLYHHGDFQVGTITLSKSADGKTWQPSGVITVNEPPQPSVSEPAVAFSAAIADKARYLRMDIKPADRSGRILVGEIVVAGPAQTKAGTRPSGPSVVRPLWVKRVLDEALLAAGVRFLYSSYATDVLRDREGHPGGLVIANRAGRQAVVAKVIVDATDRAWVARMAGAAFDPFPSGPQTVRRVVVGGKACSGENLRVREITPPFRRGSTAFNIFEYTLTVPMENGAFSSWARAEQLARDMTYHPDQQFTSDMLFQVPPDAMKGRTKVSAEWRGVDALDVDAFRPAGLPRFYVLGGCADIPRAQVQTVLRPVVLIEMGARIGHAAALEAQSLPAPAGVRVPGEVAPTAMEGEVREVLTGVRPTQELKGIPQERRSLPVLGRFDVVVIGGGTSGAPAGIAAARQGVKTLVVEYLYGLGGVGTLGAISKYYWGNRVGFTKEVPGTEEWQIEQRMEWWRKTLLKAGAEIWFGALGCGVFVKDHRVCGAVVTTPEGRGVVLADVVIDATGNADLAAAAGAPCLYTDETDIAMQGTGLPPRRLGAGYTNTDFTLVDETDLMDVWHVFVYAKVMARDAFDIGQLIDTRERRRIVGDITLTILDQVNGRTYPDTIVEAYSNFDSHGYTIDPFFTLQSPHKKGIRSHIPYRALLPKGLDGLLVTGLGISAHRDAIPVIRMQPDIQNQGYAAGVAAAMAAKARVPLRQIDIKALQKHLVDIGNLPASVLTDRDSYPMPADRIAAAVEAVKNDYTGVSVILAQPDQAVPLLRKAYAEAQSEEHKLIYAHILAVLGDASGLDVLLAKVDATADFDEGWDFRAMGQFGHNMSRLDCLIYAIGRTRERRALPSLIRKLERLSADKAFSHHRALALALEQIGDPAAAGPLAALLSKPNMRGHAVTGIDKALAQHQESPNWVTVAPRKTAIRELILARALFRCGDKDGLGQQILTEYTQDLRGHLARHAHAVLRTVAKEVKP